MSSLQVRVFGKLRLQYGDEIVAAFPTRRVEELLAFLLLHPSERHSREKLIDTLWPDASLQNGRASLSTALWRLRNIFGQLGLPAESYLEATRDWVRLQASDSLEIDLVSYQRRLAAADNALDGATCEEDLRVAVSLYEGAFCEGIYAEWCLLERERLERSYLWALGKLMAFQMARQAYDAAADIGQDILRRDPLREEVHRAIMICYWKVGQRARAVRQFQRCSHSLQAELGILPMPETLSLYRRIVEERLLELSFDGLLPGSQKEALQAAYANFLVAAEDLNSLLDRADEAVEEPIIA